MSRAISLDGLALRPSSARPVVDRETPFFSQVYVAVECWHDNVGVNIDRRGRKCYCKGCGAELDPFEALLLYATAEARLVHTKQEIITRQEKAAESIGMRAFVRDVMSVEPNKWGDQVMRGFTVVLACGHSRQSDRDVAPKRMSCFACYSAAKKEGKA